MKINKDHSTVFDESCLQRMASLTGRWQGLKLVNLRALSRTRDQSRLAVGIVRDNLGLVGSAAPANLFSSLSQPACRLNPHPCAQVYYGKPKKLAVDLIIWSGEFWITSTFSFHTDTRNTESLLSKGTRSSLINSIGGRSVQYQMSSISSISSLQFLPGRAVLEGGGTFDVPTIAAAKGSPLAKLLFRSFPSKTRPHGLCVLFSIKYPE